MDHKQFAATITADELAELKALAEENGARVLIWEAEPPASARDVVASLGLKDVVFPPLNATPVASQSFAASFSEAVRELRAAVTNSRLE